MAVLDRKICGKGLRPKDSDGIDLLRRAEIDHYPLRICRVVLFSEVLVEIRITLPKSLSVAVVKARVTVVVSLVDRVASTRQAVAITYVNWVAKLAGRDPIALTVRRIAPATVGIPMPRFAR